MTWPTKRQWQWQWQWQDSQDFGQPAEGKLVTMVCTLSLLINLLNQFWVHSFSCDMMLLLRHFSLESWTWLLEVAVFVKPGVWWQHCDARCKKRLCFPTNEVGCWGLHVNWILVLERAWLPGELSRFLFAFFCFSLWRISLGEDLYFCNEISKSALITFLILVTILGMVMEFSLNWPMAVSDTSFSFWWFGLHKVWFSRPYRKACISRSDFS